jgi:diguanylate cyclase (GGDEF)-like protein
MDKGSLHGKSFRFSRTGFKPVSSYHTASRFSLYHTVLNGFINYRAGKRNPPAAQSTADIRPAWCNIADPSGAGLPAATQSPVSPVDITASHTAPLLPGTHMQLASEHHQSPAHNTGRLSRFSRSMAELQWLLLILVLLYFFIPTRPITNTDAVVITLVIYSGFILLFRYLNFQSRETRWKLSLETWVMIAFITSAIWHTGLVESPLLNLYLLVIITSAITLGKLMTLLEVALITCCYLYMGYQTYSDDIFAPATFTTLMARFSPLLLVAYVTSMLAADILHARRRITVMSHTDEQTGLLSTRTFNLFLEKEIARVSRQTQPFTVIMVNIEGIDAITARHGQLAGKRMIQAVADALGSSIRAADVLARFSGKEFVILMAQTSKAEAKLAAERICYAVGSTALEIDGSKVSVSASIGIASFPEGVDTATEVLEKADIALSNSKQRGSGQVTCYGTGPEAVPA